MRGNHPSVNQEIWYLVLHSRFQYGDNKNKRAQLTIGDIIINTDMIWHLQDK